MKNACFEPNDFIFLSHLQRSSGPLADRAEDLLDRYFKICEELEDLTRECIKAQIAGVSRMHTSLTEPGERLVWFPDPKKEGGCDASR